MTRDDAWRLLAALAGCALLLPVLADGPSYLAGDAHLRLAPGRAAECDAEGVCAPVLSAPLALLMLTLLAAGALALHGAATTAGRSLRRAALLVPLAAGLAVLVQLAHMAAMFGSPAEAFAARESYARIVPQTLAVAGVATLALWGLARPLDRAGAGERPA